MALRLPLGLLVLASSVSIAGSSAPLPLTDPFTFLGPTIQLDDHDRRDLDERGIVLRILPAKDRELAVMAAGELRVGPETLIASLTHIADLKRSSYVPQIGRFSSPPRMEDLRSLSLDEVDIKDIAGCRPGHCALNLSDEEIDRLQPVAARASAGSGAAALETEFRQLLLDRANEYLRKGDLRTGEEFSVLLRHSPYVESGMPRVAAYLERYPAAPLPGAVSFLYWSKEMYAWKPMISISHVTIVRGPGTGGAPEVTEASRDVFASRYTSGSLVLTLLFHDAGAPNHRYLVYINRTHVDDVRPLWRPFVEYRIKRSASRVFAAIRERIEATAAGTRSVGSGQP